MSKLWASVKSIGDGGAGTWTAVASSGSVDRDDEVVEPRAFEPLPAKVVVRSQHFGGEVVGSVRPYYLGDMLHVDGRFASTPKGQEVRTLVTEGHIASMSVVFLPLADRLVGQRRHVTKAELLAVDWADIPSNRDSRVLAVRAWPRGAGAGALLAFKAQLMLLEADLAELDARETGQPVTPTSARAAAAEGRRFLDNLDRRA